MFGSKNNFFFQSTRILERAKKDLKTVLTLKARSKSDIKSYLIAFDYFVLNPYKFDGATIVKDLIDLRVFETGQYLDSDAMLHDYDYITGANKNFVKKWKADIAYIKNMELNGKGIRIPRLIILTLTGILFVPYKLLK